MKNLNIMLIAVIASLSSGCHSLKPAACLFGGTVAETKAYLDGYEHVFLVCTTGDYVTREQLPAKSERHSAGTVVRVYNGDWAIAERVSWVTLVELYEGQPVETNKYEGQLRFVFTDAHTDKEIFLDVGDAPWWGKSLAQQIETALR